MEILKVQIVFNIRETAAEAFTNHVVEILSATSTDINFYAYSWVCDAHVVKQDNCYRNPWLTSAKMRLKVSQSMSLEKLSFASYLLELTSSSPICSSHVRGLVANRINDEAFIAKFYEESEQKRSQIHNIYWHTWETRFLESAFEYIIACFGLTLTHD